MTTTAISAGALILTSCTPNTEVPSTFVATVTVTGEASRVLTDSGTCLIEEINVGPGDTVGIVGDSSSAHASAQLQVDSIIENPDGTGVCTYTAHFEHIPASQKSYRLYMSTFAEQPVTSGELKNGAIYRLHAAGSADSGTR